jgi:hypothetical protein
LQEVVEENSEWNIILGTVSSLTEGSGKHNIVSSSPNGALEFWPGTKRQKCQKRKLLLQGTLKIVYQIYHSKEEKQKRKSKSFFLSQQSSFVLP